MRKTTLMLDNGSCRQSLLEGLPAYKKRFVLRSALLLVKGIMLLIIKLFQPKEFFSENYRLKHAVFVIAFCFLGSASIAQIFAHFTTETSINRRLIGFRSQ